MAAPLIASAVILALLGVGRALGTARMARAHRDVAGFVRSLVLSVALACLALSLLLAPGMWDRAYTTVVSHWGGKG